MEDQQNSERSDHLDEIGSDPAIELAKSMPLYSPLRVPWCTDPSLEFFHFPLDIGTYSSISTTVMSSPPDFDGLFSDVLHGTITTSSARLAFCLAGVTLAKILRQFGKQYKDPAISLFALETSSDGKADTWNPFFRSHCEAIADFCNQALGSSLSSPEEVLRTFQQIYLYSRGISSIYVYGTCVQQFGKPFKGGVLGTSSDGKADIWDQTLRTGFASCILRKIIEGSLEARGSPKLTLLADLTTTAYSSFCSPVFTKPQTELPCSDRALKQPMATLPHVVPHVTTMKNAGIVTTLQNEPDNLMTAPCWGSATELEVHPPSLLLPCLTESTAQDNLAQYGGGMVQLDASNQQSMDPIINSGRNGGSGEQCENVVTHSQEKPKCKHKIQISFEDILQQGGKKREDAANCLKISQSTLKCICREFGIDDWRKIKKDNHSLPIEFVQGVDQEQILKSSSNVPSMQASAIVAHTKLPDTAMQDANMVSIKAKYVNDIIIRFELSFPYKLVELQQQVAKRLNLEAGTYYIKYKDEDNDLILIACDDDLERLCTCRLQGSSSVEVFLQPK